MICVSDKALQERASTMPIGYLADCQASATKDKNGLWWFSYEDFKRLSDKYAKYARSEADPYRERISGCCDRADQY